VATSIVEVRNVSKSFGVKVLDDLSVSVGAGDALGIVGPNGAGKTTLMNVITGDLLPDAGSIVFEGRDITRLRADKRVRVGVARTAQIPRPFEQMTVGENVLAAAVFGSGSPRREHVALPDAAAALERTGLSDRANRPAGSLALLDRKRLELARALATGPSLLLLDEIAGGLTDAEVQELVDTVRVIRAEGVTIIWIEHIVRALLAVVDRIMAMSFGVKIAEGDPHEVMDSPQVREVYLGMDPA